mgnify:FL=1
MSMKNRKMRLFSHVMTVVLMMSMMLVNILPTHAVGSTPAPVSETINFGASGTLKINVKPTSQTEVSGTDNISTGIEIDGTGLTQPVDGLYLEVEVNTKQSSKNFNDTNNIESNTYLDNFSTPAAKTQPIIKSEETIVTNDGRTIKRIYLNTIDNTVKLELPYVMSFSNGITPKDFELKPIVRVYDSSKTNLATLKDQTYTIKYKNPWLIKQVAGEETDDQLVYGGINRQGDPNSLSDDRTADVIFNFRLFQYERAYRAVIITDTLPTYVNYAGQTVTAHFDPAKNPNWTLSADGKTVTLRYDVPNGVPHLGDNYRDNLPAYSELRLSFPGAKYLNGSNRVVFENNATLQGLPYNPSAAEDTIGKVAGNEHNFASNGKKFRLAGDDFSGDGMLSKRGLKTLKFDKNSLAVQEVDYGVTLINKIDRPLTDIEFIEDVANTDNRLFLTKFYGNLVAFGSKIGFQMSQVEIRGYKDDGTYDILPVTPDGQNWLFKSEMNQTGKTQLRSYLDQINDGSLDPANAAPIVPQYKKVGLYLKDVTLQPTNSIIFNLKMMFMDPFHEEYSATKPLTNVIKVTSNKVNDDGSKTPLNLTSAWNTYFTPLNEKVHLWKQTLYQRVGMPNERFTARVNFSLTELSSARYFKNPTYVDLLPTGVSFDNLTNVVRVVNNIEGWSSEFIKNYNNTGRDAIKIKMPSGYAYQFENMCFDIRELVINDDIIPSKAENDTLNNNNEVYFYADNWTNGVPPELTAQYDPNIFVNDDLDINMNGITNEKILKATSKVLGNNVESIRSDKHIRSLEPNVEGGAAVYGRAFTNNTITTDFADVTNTSGLFQYRISVRNYYNTPMNKIVMYDVFPFVGDGRNSAFSNTLQGPVELKIGSDDVSSMYDIYYRTDKYPNLNDVNELNSPLWTTTPTDYSQVTAIKIVGKDGTILEPYRVLSAYLTMKTPTYDPSLTGAIAYNSANVIYNNESIMRKVPPVANQLIDVMDVSVSKKWIDADGNPITTPDVTSITAKLFADGVDTGKTVDITAANNWKATFTHLRQYNVVTASDGTTTKTPIEYSVEEVGVNGEGQVTYGGKKYQVTSTSGKVNQNSPTDAVALEITNKLVQEKVSVSGKKFWVDDDDNDGKRPSSITVRLLADGVEVQNKTVTEDDNWEFTFTDLPKFKGSTEIVYTISEDAVADYSTSISNYDIANTHAPEQIVIPVKKVWVDNNDAQSLRPTSVHVKLFADGEKVDEVDLNSANSWQYIFTGLSRYRNGHEIQYTVKEDAVTNYSTAYSGDMTSTITITNTIDGKVSIPVTKKWIGKAAESATIHLLADGQEAANVTLNADNNWQYTFTDMPKYKDGKLITYTISEDAIAGYTTAITGDATNYVVTNTNMKTIDIPVTKNWVGTEGTSAEIILSKDGNEIDRITLNAANNWTHTFTNLELYDKTDGHEYAYTVKETDIAGYEKNITGNEADGFTVTNTYKPTPVTVNPDLKKTVEGNPANPAKFTFNFKALDANNPMPEGSVDGIKEATITGSGTTSIGNIEFKLPGTYVYELTEVQGAARGYTYDQTVYTFTYKVKDVNGDLQSELVITKGTEEVNTAEFTNVYKPNPVKVDPPVEKVVVGSPENPSTFTFRLKTLNPNNPMPQGSSNGVKAVTITGAGETEFGEFEFTEEGTYVYEISEEVGSDSNYAYDASTYTITYTVTDDNGQLVVDTMVVKDDGTQIPVATFVNTYTEPKKPTPPTSDSNGIASFATMLLVSILGFAAAVIKKNQLSR